ncbi:MAG TPA: glycerol-3-phosphate acyltransferase [Candidatus Cloacimonadota bacterium]|nr:glycerol-3-phosphate acyltransferase [Candidatus Cloacimonadota bacterium]HOV16939.1 glycerol-3-phosphate acyltransferase [Candidatus Cloacimonadota bacterium]HQL15096.1 glycerol-3-phosphate acyltransferase [Candidatus Cloacimonadota bacterium]
MMVIVGILLILLSYWIGCFSTARMLARNFHSLNINKVGTGLADTENIFHNVSRSLGILSGTLDCVKSFAWLYLLRLILIAMDRMAIPPDLSPLYSDNLLLLYAVAMLIGHCLPLTHHLRGGRGIFTYFGIMLFFAPVPALITGLVSFILVYRYKQVRFAQYTIVILPVLLNLVLGAIPLTTKLIQPSHAGTLFTTKLIGMAVLMGILNILVSKKWGEI